VGQHRHRKNRAQLGQSLTEFALVAPVLLFLLFGIIESSLVVFVVGSGRFAAGEASRQAAQSGNQPNADTMAVQVIRNGALGTTSLASVTEVDIYRLVQQPGGQLTVDSTKYNRYRLDGTPITSPVPWPPASRNVRYGQTDFLGVMVNFQYFWRTGKLLSAAPLQLSQPSYVQLEPQAY
jgi:Flp pilus assembly protein TadG